MGRVNEKKIDVRPFVCPSVILENCVYMAEDIVKLLSDPVPHRCSFFNPQRKYPIPRRTLSAGAQNTRGEQNLRLSTEIAVYLGNGIR